MSASRPIDIKSLVIQQMRADQFEDRVFTVIKQAYTGVINAHGIVLSRTENDRLLREVVKELLEEMLKKL
jgi:hypothetical protein